MTGRPRLFDGAYRARRPVRLIEEDPDLFRNLPPSGQLEARARAVAPTLHITSGRWNTCMDGVCDPADCLGLLLLEGLIVHSVDLVGQPRSEIVGPGDVLRPWQEHDVEVSVPFQSEWHAVSEARIAVLDARTVAFACRWPRLMLAIVERTMRRTHWLTLQLAIADLRRVDDRLMLLFWHLADRWGHVGADGVRVPLPVTHDVIAQLVCAQRPSVTSALKRLTDAGKLQRRPDKTWLLDPQAERPPAVHAAVG